MAILRVQFRDPVPSIGESWSKEKNGNSFTLIEKGAWLIITPATGKALVGKRMRVPVSNVLEILEEDVVERMP